MATKNSINNETQELTVDPGASGDSFIQFDINGTGKFRIGVDDTDDSFRISQGSALGTSDTFVMTAAGERTMPLQPAFLANLQTTDSDVTGDGTNFTLGSGNSLTIIFDNGGNVTTAGVFTAPVTGRYLFQVLLQWQNTTSSHTLGRNSIVTSNGTHYIHDINPGSLRTSSQGEYGSIGCTFADMDVSDTATVNTVVSGSGKTVEVRAQGASRYTLFSGTLIC